MDEVPTYSVKDEKMHPLLSKISFIISLMLMVIWILVRFINLDELKILRGHPASIILIISVLFASVSIFSNRKRKDIMAPKIDNIENQLRMLDDIPIEVAKTNNTNHNQNSIASAIIDDVLGTPETLRDTNEAISKLMVVEQENVSTDIKESLEPTIGEIEIPPMIDLPTMIDLPPLDED